MHSNSSTSVTLLSTGPGQSVLAEVGGGEVRMMAYTAHGEQDSAQPGLSRMGFNGQLRERPQGWYHLGHGRRVYSPALKRFYSPDPLSPFDSGGLNPYTYCLGDPLNLVDPTGGQAETLHYLSLISSGMTLLSGFWSLGMPRLLAKAPAGSWRQTWAQSKPGIAAPVGGVDAVATVTGMVSGLVGAGATVLNMQQPNLAPSGELMIASFALSNLSLMTKAGITAFPTQFAPGSRMRRVGVLLHGEKKVARVEAADLKSASRSRSPTPAVGGPEDLELQEMAHSRSSSLSASLPPTPPPTPVPAPRLSLMRPPAPRSVATKRDTLVAFADLLKRVRVSV